MDLQAINRTEQIFFLSNISDNLLRVCRSKKLYLVKKLPVQTKMAILSRTLILLTILLYEQFIHYTQVNLSANMQFLSTQQRANESVQKPVYSRFKSFLKLMLYCYMTMSCRLKINLVLSCLVLSFSCYFLV